MSGNDATAVRGPRAPIRATAALIGVVLAAIALVGILMLTGRKDVGVAPSPRPSGPSSELPVTASASPSASATATSPSALATGTPIPVPTVFVAQVDFGLAWAPTVVGIDGGQVSRVVAEAGRFYALGSFPTYEAALGDAAIWSSDDGRTWGRVLLPFPRSWERQPPVFIHARQLASIDGRLVAIGVVGALDYLNVVVWESEDGASWTEVDTGEFMKEAFAVTDVTNGPAGLVTTSHGFGSGTASAWRSMDGGNTWTEHRPTGEYLEAWAVVGTSSGYVMAGSTDSASAVEPHPRIWGSADGADWNELSLEGSDGLGMVAQVTVSGSGRWAAIGTLNGQHVAWWSNDGRSWNLAGSLQPMEAHYAANSRLIGQPDGFIATDGAREITTWTSHDGRTWMRAEHEQPGGLQGDGLGLAAGIARVGDVVLLAGNDYGAQGEDYGWVTWTGSIER